MPGWPSSVQPASAAARSNTLLACPPKAHALSCSVRPALQVSAWLWSSIWFVGGVPGAYILW